MNIAQQLHYEFIKFGRIRLSLKNKMLAILPDIYESGIWKKYAGSIIEYCGKFGDIAPTTVMKRLKIEPLLKDKPYLRAAIETAGVHKVAMVAKLATPETDKNYAEKVLNMSKTATQTMSKEERAAKKSGRTTEQNVGLFGDEQKQHCSAVPTLKKIELDADASFLFMKLKAKFGKHLSDSKFIKLVLEATNAANEKTKKIKQTVTENFTGDIDEIPVTRYIHAPQKREVIARTNGRCSYPNCNLPYAVIHHTDRYSESKSLKSIILLCKVNHEFAHNNLIVNEQQISCEWRMAVVKNPSTKNSLADVLYRKYRLKALM